MTELRPLEITRNGIRIAIAGEIRSIADRDLLRTRVAEAIEELKSEKPELVLDVAGARYLDAYALTVIVSVAKKCVDVGLTLALEGADDDLMHLLRITRIDKVLGRCGTRIDTRPVA